VLTKSRHQHCPTLQLDEQLGWIQQYQPSVATPLTLLFKILAMMILRCKKKEKPLMDLRLSWRLVGMDE
jgi:hypothetical protein